MNKDFYTYFTPEEQSIISFSIHEGTFLDIDSDLYEKLMQFTGAYDGPIYGMPYGTMKARDGDPYEWLFDRMSDLVPWL